MIKPRIFLGSSGEQKDLVDFLTRGLSDIARVDPWTTSFDPGPTTLDRLVELTHEVDLAAFVFANDDWTTNAATDSSHPGALPRRSRRRPGQGSPRDNVVFEAGLFGGVLGMHRTLLLHSEGAKLPTDLLGITSIRYAEPLTLPKIEVIVGKLRKAVEDHGRVTRIEGSWWQFSLSDRTKERSVVSLMIICRGRDGELELTGRSWGVDGRLSAKYRSEAVKERPGHSGVFYYWKGEKPLDANAPQFDGVGEIRLETSDRAYGHYTVQSTADPTARERISTEYLRANLDDKEVLHGQDEQKRAALVAKRLAQWEGYRRA
jgi:hypothetical protein